MEFNLGEENWCPINMIDASDYSGVPLLAYSDVSVSYRINGGPSVIKTLALADWSEGTNGAYSLRFSAAECAVEGKLAFEVTHTGCAVYYGSADVKNRSGIAVLPTDNLAADLAAILNKLRTLTSRLGQ
jgi:hypothetical protein